MATVALSGPGAAPSISCDCDRTTCYVDTLAHAEALYVSLYGDIRWVLVGPFKRCVGCLAIYVRPKPLASQLYMYARLQMFLPSPCLVSNF